MDVVEDLKTKVCTSRVGILVVVTTHMDDDDACLFLCMTARRHFFLELMI
jgi:hypothetical protein